MLQKAYPSIRRCVQGLTVELQRGLGPGDEDADDLLVPRGDAGVLDGLFGVGFVMAVFEVRATVWRDDPWLCECGKRGAGGRAVAVSGLSIRGWAATEGKKITTQNRGILDNKRTNATRKYIAPNKTVSYLDFV